MTELFRWAKYLIYFLLFTQIYVYYRLFISEQTLARPCQRNLICKFELAIGKCQGPLWREHLITIGYALVSACTYGQCGHISAHMALGEILRPFFSWLRRNQQLQMYQPWICLRMAMTFPLQLPKSSQSCRPRAAGTSQNGHSDGKVNISKFPG